MPELPEVEVIRRGLEPHVCNKPIIGTFCSGKKLRKPIDIPVIEKVLLNTSFTRITRRAKYLLLHSNNGILLIHLGMTGSLGVFQTDSPPRKHDHFTVLFADETQMRYNDTRRFGFILPFVDQTASQVEQSFFAAYGPEPLSPHCNPSYLYQRAQNRKLPVKTFLMDNRHVVGIGNIYANETLFAAGIHPRRRCSTLTLEEWHHIHHHLVATLKWAIDCGGSTISDFINASGESGYFQANFKVYGKAEQPCPDCSQKLQKETIGGRTSYFCKNCQK